MRESLSAQSGRRRSVVAAVIIACLGIVTLVLGPAASSMAVGPLALPSATLPTGVDGQSYSSGSAIAATGGTGPYSYALTNSTSLPLGMSLDPSTAEITGAPFGTTGSTGIVVTVTDGAAQTATQSFTLILLQADPVLPSVTLSHGSVGASYGDSVQATGTPPITYSITAGALPPGLAVANKNIAGTPTQVGTFTFTVTASNDHSPYGSGSDSHQYTIIIDPDPPVMTGLASPGGATVGTPYSYTVTPSGGTAPFTFAVTSGSLPAGLTLNTSTGVISGSATGGGTSTFTVSATNGAGSDSASLTIVSSLVVPALPSSTTAASATVGTLYSYAVSPSGTGPFSFSVAGVLPAGLSLNSATGVISGTPTAAGTGSFSVTATNSAGSATTAVTLVVNAAPSVTPPSVSSTTVDLTIGISVGESALGAPVTATATGLLPGASWVVTLHSTPVVLGSGTVPSSGNLSEPLTLPRSIDPGSHYVVLESTSSSGSPMSSRAWIAVSSNGQLAALSYSGPVTIPAALASTGADAAAPALLASALSLLGLLLVIAAYLGWQIRVRRAHP